MLVVIAVLSEHGRKVIVWHEICSNLGGIVHAMCCHNTEPEDRVASDTKSVRHFECACGPWTASILSTVHTPI